MFLSYLQHVMFLKREALIGAFQLALIHLIYSVTSFSGKVCFSLSKILQILKEMYKHLVLSTMSDAIMDVDINPIYHLIALY